MHEDTCEPSGPLYREGEMVDDKYELIELLGTGGMASVWRARDRLLDIDVALKLIRPRESFPGALERLLCEARAAASINDPSIVRILAFGKKDADAYIAMELLEGQTLEDCLEELECLSPFDAIRLLLPIARALEAVHERGVVHRDVKPANIFLASSDDGAVMPKLLDFGIARAELPLPRRLTVTGQVMGTPHYMSPEQAAGRHDVDHRADIWALCAVIYESIAGIPPFDGDNYNALLSAILLQPMEPLSRVSEVDADLCALVQRGLQKKPELRYQSARELADAMERWLVHYTLRIESAVDSTDDDESEDESEHESAVEAPATPMTLTAPMLAPPVFGGAYEGTLRASMGSWSAPRMPTVGLGMFLVAVSFAATVSLWSSAPVIPWDVDEAARAASSLSSHVALLAPPNAALRRDQEDASLAACEPPPQPAPTAQAVGPHKTIAKGPGAGSMPLPLAPEF